MSPLGGTLVLVITETGACESMALAFEIALLTADAYCGSLSLDLTCASPARSHSPTVPVGLHAPASSVVGAPPSTMLPPVPALASGSVFGSPPVPTVPPVSAVLPPVPAVLPPVPELPPVDAGFPPVPFDGEPVSEAASTQPQPSASPPST